MPQPNPFAEVMTSVRRLRPALVATSSFVNILLLVTAIYMLQIYDRVLSSGSLDTLFWLTVVALGAIAIYGILEQSRRLILARAAGHMESRLTMPLLRQSMERRVAGIEAEASVKDITDLRSFYQADAILAFYDAPWSLLFIGFVWMLHPTLGVILTVGALVLLAATILNDFATRQRQKEAAGEVRAANEAAIKYVEGGETIGPLGMANAVFSRWQSWQDRTRSKQQALTETTTTILSFTRSIRMALQVVILGTGAYFVLAGEITAGAMIAASIIGGRALAPIDRLTAAWHRFVAARSARGNLGRMFESVAAQANATRLPAPMGRVSVEDLTYLTPQNREPILENVGLEISPGEICAIVGPSGAGKSTLCKLIVGAWKPTAGHVRLDGADAYNWHSEDLGPHIGYLPQKVELFPGTVAENIARFGPPDANATVHAAKLAGAHEMILRLPRGYETDVGPQADRISLGQRQRIGLARALYGDPALIVLDEPNSNLDSAGDTALLQALKNLKDLGDTVILVSHRTEVLKQADTVVRLSGGRVERIFRSDEFVKPKARKIAKTAVAVTGEGLAENLGSGSRVKVTQTAWPTTTAE